MTSSIDTFEQTAKLDTAALRSLLDSRRPEQRIWAIWALALRKHGPELAPRTAVEQDPGVRRTLAVILASHGETDLLVALARHDPHLVVRASAMQLVARLAAGGAIHPSVIADAAGREPEIQLAILAATDASAPGFLLDIAAGLLDHGSSAVQVEAFEVLVRVATPASVARATAWLCAASEPHATEAFRRWVCIAAPRAIASALAPLPAAVRQIALRELRAPSWPVIEPLVGGDLSLLLDIAHRSDLDLPASVLARLLLQRPCLTSLAALRRRLARLDALPPELVDLVPDLRSYSSQRADVLRTEKEREQLALTVLEEGTAFDRDEDGMETALGDHFDLAECRWAEQREVAALLAQLDRLAPA
jgi:hypothetical protein